MLQFFDTLTDVSGNALLGATVTVTNYPSGTAATIYSTNGTANPIANNTVQADITGQVSFFVPDGTYILTYAYKSVTYKTRSPVQILDPMGFVAQTDSGVANAYVVTSQQVAAQIYAGMKIEILVGNANTGASTLVVNGSAAVPILQPNLTPLLPGMMPKNSITRLEYDGTQWQLIGAQLPQPFYNQTAQELSRSITPTDFTQMPFPFYDVRRTGAKGDGVTDDTAAIQQALNVGSVLGIAVVIPYGFTFKITNYISLPSNTSLHIMGTVSCTNRNSGFYSAQTSNILIQGYKGCLITDSTVANQLNASITAITKATNAVVTINTGGTTHPFTNYIGQQLGITGAFGMTQANAISGVLLSIGGVSGAWTCTLSMNTSSFSTYTSGGTLSSGYLWNGGLQGAAQLAPVVHLRAVVNATVRGLTINKTCLGVMVSNATTNTITNAAWVTSLPSPTNVKVEDCDIQNCEFGGLTGLGGTNLTFQGNYVYRCGDGGLWFMGCFNSKMLNNRRVSPTATPAVVVTNGVNNQAVPATWNDLQGLQFENCYNLQIRGNTVEAMWSQGIDIKNLCNWVDCIDNTVRDNENASIVVREGDAAKNPVSKVVIAENKIINHGTLQLNISAGAGLMAAIRVGECYIADVVNNTIWGYQAAGLVSPYGIYMAGPGAYLAANYSGNPHQATCVVKGNRIHFGADAQEAFFSFSYAATTPTAVNINGFFDSVICDDNFITTDAQTGSDRVGTIPAITLTYLTASSTYYPMNASISGNTVSGWGNHGIQVTGLQAMANSGLNITGNKIGQCKGSGIVVTATHSATIVGNTVTQPGSGAGFPGISLNGSSGNVLDGVNCSGNSVTGRFVDGTNAMTSGIDTNFAANMKMQNNVIKTFATANQRTFNLSGNHDFSGTSGFPRTNAGSPNGSVTGLWQGELLFDTTNLKWWACSTFGTTTWTQLSN